jgi:adenylylsulfate kinase
VVVVKAEALLVTGTVGSGKTTTADRVAERLSSRGVAFAAIDLDAVRHFGPTPAEDPFGFQMELRNLRSLVENYLSNGAQRIVLAGVCESRRDRARYEAVLGVPLTVCRLRVSPSDVEARLRARHVDDPAGLRWHLARAGELEAVLDQSDAADVEVLVGGLSREQVADAVLHAVGWAS